jgi:hypothetical protein
MIKDKIAYCDCCGCKIYDRNEPPHWKRQFYMSTAVIRSLSSNSVIPHLCSEDCCNRYAKIRNNGD